MDGRRKELMMFEEAFLEVWEDEKKLLMKKWRVGDGFVKRKRKVMKKGWRSQMNDGQMGSEDGVI